MTLGSEISRNIKLLNGSVFIAYCTLMGYALSISYQSGYNSYFSIPKYMISVDIASILQISFFTFLGLNFFWLLCDFLIKRLVRIPYSEFGASFFAYLLLVLVSILYWIYIYPPNINQILLPLFTLFYLGFFEFVVPLLMSKKETYIEKFDDWIEVKKRDNTDSIFNLVIANISNIYLIIFIISIFVLFIANTAGVRNAKTLTIFDMISYPENSVVLQKYKDYLIVSRYDSKTNQLDGKIQLVSLDDISKNGYYITSTTTGKLIPK